MTMTAEQIMRRAFPVMPVLAVEDVEHAAPIAEALFKGGLQVLEVTLRTPVALEVIKAMKAAVPDAIVGAGTVTRPEQFDQLAQVEADFAISPGATPALLEAGQDAPMPFLPAIATVSELMQGMEYGHRHFKFFPAEAAGGIKTLKSIAGPFPDIGFCPTGGISPANFVEYLALNNVLCVGGSWVVPGSLVASADWRGIEELARETVRLASV